MDQQEQTSAMLAVSNAMVQLHKEQFGQVATAGAFIAAVEGIVHRRVRAFASAIDPDNNVVFENFSFEPGS